MAPALLRAVGQAAAAPGPNLVEGACVRAAFGVACVCGESPQTCGVAGQWEPAGTGSLPRVATGAHRTPRWPLWGNRPPPLHVLLLRRQCTNRKTWRSAAPWSAAWAWARRAARRAPAAPPTTPCSGCTWTCRWAVGGGSGVCGEAATGAPVALSGVVGVRGAGGRVLRQAWAAQPRALRVSRTLSLHICRGVSAARQAAADPRARAHGRPHGRAARRPGGERPLFALAPRRGDRCRGSGRFMLAALLPTPRLTVSPLTSKPTQEQLAQWRRQYPPVLLGQAPRADCPPPQQPPSAATMHAARAFHPSPRMSPPHPCHPSPPHAGGAHPSPPPASSLPTQPLPPPPPPPPPAGRANSNVNAVPLTHLPPPRPARHWHQPHRRHPPAHAAEPSPSPSPPHPSSSAAHGASWSPLPSLSPCADAASAATLPSPSMSPPHCSQPMPSPPSPHHANAAAAGVAPAAVAPPSQPCDVALSPPHAPQGAAAPVAASSALSGCSASSALTALQPSQMAVPPPQQPGQAQQEEPPALQQQPRDPPPPRAQPPVGSVGEAVPGTGLGSDGQLFSHLGVQQAPQQQLSTEQQGLTQPVPPPPPQQQQQQHPGPSQQQQQRPSSRLPRRAYAAPAPAAGAASSSSASSSRRPPPAAPAPAAAPWDEGQQACRPPLEQLGRHAFTWDEIGGVYWCCREYGWIHLCDNTCRCALCPSSSVPSLPADLGQCAGC